MSTTSEPNQPLIVIVSGGGPVGLTFALNLTMMMGKYVKIIIYEGRWFVDKDGRIRWQGEEQGNTRRDQVVTLQDDAINQMPEYVQKGLFKNINERVWPTSRNIPIREVEDRLFRLIQPFVQTGQIELVPENLHEQCECLINGNFDVLIGADGSNSFVRQYCNIQMVSEGVEYACGVAYNIPTKVSSDDEPLHQSVNCILTVSQTRYLVNSSDSRRGYLCIRLIKDEYIELQTRLQELQLKNESLDLTDSRKCPHHSPIWTIIRQGLEFFKISSKYVFRVAPIAINVRHASIVARELRFEIANARSSVRKQYKTALAFLAGDAAINVHFWPGRGMNSGMKAAMALARCILRSCTRNYSIHVRLPLRFLDFIDYEGFMARLRAREQQGRSLRVLINPVDKSIQRSYLYSHSSDDSKACAHRLSEKLKETRDRLEVRPDWPHQSTKITDDELETSTNRVLAQTIAQLSLGNPWPTREMSGIEVLVEHLFPYELKNFLPVPKSEAFIETPRLPTQIIQPLFVNLWVTGNVKTHRIDTLISEIQNAPNFQSISKNVNPLHRLFTVETPEKAKQWIKSNQSLLQENQVQFKVVTPWTITEHQTAIHVIDIVRSELPHIPILIFTNQKEEAQAAAEFPNVSITDQQYDLKQFVGVNQETQWNPGCEVITSLTCSSSASTRCQQNETLLLWIDLEENVPQSSKRIRNKYPNLEVHFEESYFPAKTYLDKSFKQIQKYKQFIVITRDYHKNDLKSFVHVYQLLQSLRFHNLHIVVYTHNPKDLMERNPDSPQGIRMVTNPKELVDFLDPLVE